MSCVDTICTHICLVADFEVGGDIVIIIAQLS